MNNGLSDILKAAFTNTIPVQRPLVEIPKKIDPNWLAGFTAAEGFVSLVLTNLLDQNYLWQFN